MTSLVVISAGLGQPSSTRLLADQLSAAAARELLGSGESVAVSVIELREIAHQITDHLLTGFPGEKLRAVLDSVAAADALIVVTPVFSASYSGLFKSFFDVLTTDALAGKPVLIAATGGSARHCMILDHALRPLLSFLRAVVLPTGIFAATADFGSPELAGRVQAAARELATAVSGARPAPRKNTASSFEALLAAHRG